MGLSAEIGIVGAHDDPGMARSLLMEPDEVFPIDGHQDPVLRPGESKDILVGDGLPSPAGLLDRQHLMTQPP